MVSPSAAWRWLLSLVAAVCLLTGSLPPVGAQAPQASPTEVLDLANGLFDRESWEAALARYQEFIAANPKSTQLPSALLRAGECCYKLTRHAEALPYFARLTTEFAQAEESIQGWYRLGDIQLHQGMPAEAAAAYQAVLDRGPTSALASGAAYWLGEALYRQGKTSEAIAAYEKSLTLNPDPNYAAYANYSIGVATIRTGDLEGGTARLQGVLDKYPQHELVPEVTYLLGEANFLAKDYPAARQRYERVVKDFPQSRFALLSRSGLGRLLCTEGKLAEGLAVFQEVMQGKDVPAAREAAMRAADCLYLLGRYGKSAAAYVAIADQKDEPDAPLARFWSGMALEQGSDRAAARQAFEQFVAASPDHERAAEAYLHLGALQADAGALDTAEKSYQAAEARASSPEAKARARYGAAWVAYERTGGVEALVAMEKLAEEAPESSIGAQAQYQAGKLRLARADYPRATALLSLLLQHHPNDPNVPEGVYLLGVASEKAGDTTQAENSYKRAAQQHPQSEWAAEATARLAILAARAGRLPEAQDLTAQLKQRSPGSSPLASAQVALAEALFGRKDYADAALQYEAAVNGKPGDLAPGAQYGLAASYMALGQFASAAAAFRQYLERYPQAPQTASARYDLAGALLRSGDLAGAAKELEALLAVAPQGDLADQALLDLGCAYTDLKDAARALLAFQRLLQEFPQSSYAAEALFRTGELHFGNGEYPAAQAAYARLLSDYKDSTLADEANYKLGWSLLKQDKVQEAIQPFLTTADKASDPAMKADAQYQAASALLRQAQFAEAGAMLERLRREPPAGLECPVLLLLGQAYLGQKDYEHAVRAFQEFVTKHPEDQLLPRAWLGLGRALRGQRDFEKAVAALARAAAAEDRQVAMEAQFELAETRRLQGDPRAAATEYLKVATILADPQWGARAQYAAGLCYEQANAPEEAIKTYKKVLESYKEQAEWVQKAQERLRVLQPRNE